MDLAESNDSTTCRRRLHNAIVAKVQSLLWITKSQIPQQRLNMELFPYEILNCHEQLHLVGFTVHYVKCHTSGLRSAQQDSGRSALHAKLHASFVGAHSLYARISSRLMSCEDLLSGSRRRLIEIRSSSNAVPSPLSVRKAQNTAAAFPQLQGMPIDGITPSKTHEARIGDMLDARIRQYLNKDIQGQLHEPLMTRFVRCYRTPKMDVAY